ncbi:MAG: chromosomal replication initiator protein DnaA [Tannerella sp.]|jgi:chromosomal replication initiator protein|nr:chromosomal replication initiator protein DnaA [Tannerella sp.]
MQPDYHSLWNKCLAIIKDIVPEATYHIWFPPIVPVSYEDKKLTIQVPSQFFYEYLEEKFVDVLKMTLNRVFGTGTILNYRVVVEKSQPEATIDYKGSASPKKAETAINIPGPFTRVAPQDLDDQLNPRYTVENFFEGTSNKLARRAGETVAAYPGKTSFNPLMLYGHSGVGKTHLCHAIGQRTRELHPDKRVLYVSANLFQIQYTDAVRKNTTNDFLNFYQSLDVLILDDIHEMIGKQQTQNTFFHIFNNLHQLGKQLIMTSDKAPVDIQGMEERLLTRLKWGLTAEISRPDKALRKKILKEKIEHDGIVVKEDVFDYIAEHVTENIRDLEGILVSLMAHSLINNQEIDIPLARQIISQTVSIKPKKQLSIEKIREVVCDYFQLKQDLIQTVSRKREIVQARQITMYLAKKYTQASLSHIGKIVGGKDHATVLHACKTVQDQMEINKTFRSTIESIEESLEKQEKNSL